LLSSFIWNEQIFVQRFAPRFLFLLWIKMSLQIITKQTDGELYQAKCHGFIPGIHASQNEQHRAHLARGVNKNED